jgi:hypothetical protein
MSEANSTTIPQASTDTNRVIQRNIEGLDKYYLKGEVSVRRSDDNIKLLDKILFSGARRMTVTARNAIPRMILANFLTTAPVAFGMMLGMFKRNPGSWYVCSDEDIEIWAEHKDIRKHWLAQYKEEDRKFYHTLKWSIFHPCHHWTMNALADMWTGTRVAFNELPSHVFGTPTAQSNNRDGHVLGISSM